MGISKSRTTLLIAWTAFLLGTASQANLLNNAELEYGSGENIPSWQQWGEAKLEGWAAHGGTNGLAFYGWTTGGGIYQERVNHGIQNYELSAWGFRDADFTNALTVEMKLEFRTSNNVTLAVATNVIMGSAAWNQHVLNARSPEGTEIVRSVLAFGGTAGSGGAFKWDDISLTFTNQPTHYVAPGGSSTPPYTNWATAAHDIQDAIDAAAAEDYVIVSNGVWHLSSTLVLPGDRILQSANGRDLTILDGGNSRRCVYMGGTNAMLRGFTITNGYTTLGTSAQAFGGGIHCAAGTVLDCRITGNTVSNGGGGGIYLSTGAVLRASIIDGNEAIGREYSYSGSSNAFALGGGIHARAALIEDCVISDNKAWRHYALGGGIYALTSTIRRCTVTDNTAEGGTVWHYYGGDALGGGVYAGDGSILEDSSVAGNRAEGRSDTYYSCGKGVGGGIFLTNSQMSRMDIKSNEAIGGGSGGHCVSSPGKGGGAYCDNSFIENCLLADNIATGGVFGLYASASANAYGGGLFLRHTLAGSCTVADNMTLGGGGASPSKGPGYGYGAVYLDDGGILFNNIVYYNEDHSSDIYAGGSTYSYSYCCHPLSGGTGNITNAPVFADRTGGDYRLSPSSPCINIGTNEQALGNIDLRGNLRIAQGRVDLGAYELGDKHYVVAYSPTPAAPYTTWATAAATIQDAVDAAVDGGMVLVSNGTFTLGGPIVVSNAVTVCGVTGDPEDVVVQGNDIDRCFYLSHDRAMLDSLTITNGRAPYENDTGRGGGVYSTGGGILTNCLITGNVADGGDSYATGTSLGGGVFLNGSGSVYNCSIIGNDAYGGTAHGGGLYCAGPNDVIDGCTIDNNGAYGGVNFMYYGKAGIGGGVFAHHDVIIQNSTLSDNTAAGHQGYYGTAGGLGGAVYCANGSLVDNCIMQNNTALGGDAGGRSSSGGGLGGAVYAQGATITRCQANMNTAQGGYSGSGGWGSGGYASGGGIYNWSGRVERTMMALNQSLGGDCTPYDGAGTARGGGLYNWNGTAQNCIVVHNQTIGGDAYGNTGNGGGALGGGIYNYTGTVQQCTISDNSATGGLSHITGFNNGVGYGGGIYVSGGKVDNSIAYYNDAQSNDNCHLASGTIAYSCTTPDPGGTGIITAAPDFADASNDDFQLVYGSPCIDTGTTLSDITTDYEGTTRPLDGDFDTIPEYDIGAFEYDPQAADADGDALSDYDEVVVYLCDPENPDSDGDTMWDNAEAIAGTSATNALDYLAMEQSHSSDWDGSGLVIRWPSVAGRQYTLERSTDLQNGFTPIAMGIAATPAMNVYTDLTATAQGPYFYKVRVQQN